MVAFLLASSTAPAWAGDGYFQNGIGARNKAIAGAGVADGTDATAISLNPAGLANAGNELAISASALNYHRGYTSTGTGGVTAGGEHTSGNEWFAVPNIAINRRVDWSLVDAIAFSIYANGGINTQYADAPNANCAVLNGGSGLNCGGALGLNLTQTFISVGFAKQLKPGLSIGIAPLVARQQFRLAGVSLFSGLSSDPANFSDRGTSETWGGGVKGGVEWALTPGIKFGIAGTSRVNMGRMPSYSGVLAEQGKLDIPANLQAGLSFQVHPDVKLFADFRRIWYSSVASVGNPSTNPAQFGLPNGPGFGLPDTNVYKFGAEWQKSPDLTLRAGYSYGAPGIRGTDADLNILTGGTERHHFTTGLKYKMTEQLDLELGAMYAPRATVAGPELLNAARNVEINARTYEFTIGAVYRFDSGKAAATLK